MEKEIQRKWNRWNQVLMEDGDLAEELDRIRLNEAEIEEHFYKDLQFGTGGLRGVIGVGTNCMNIYTVGQAAQGYASYLNKKFDQPTVAIAYDSRIKSDVFARRAAGVLAANGIHVYIFQELMPTPALSFAVRDLHCSGGIVITASHNPAIYNGFKVYGNDGGQITAAAADAISAEIAQIDPFLVHPVIFEDALAWNLISYIGEDTITAYLQAVSCQAFGGKSLCKDISIVYTPLNGTGLRCVTETLRSNGFTKLTIVKEQERPDGTFPTCPYPNPEFKETLELGIQYAKRTGSDLLLATDPDCDRVGTAVRHGTEYDLLTGNEMGILLFDYICKRRSGSGRMPQRPILVKTIVTTDLVTRIAVDYGVEVINVLTGFKYIGEQIGLLEDRSEAERYIFGFEESCGYLSGGFVRDKDGVNACLLICEMAAYYKSLDKTLPEILDAIYQKYGYCLNTLRSYQFESIDGARRMDQVMRRLRTLPPTKLGGKNVVKVRDYECSDAADSLPKSNVLKIFLDDQCSVVIRPSGTEPKLKVYFSVSARKEPEARKAEEQMAEELEQILY